MKQNLEQAMRTISSTMYHHKSDNAFPYFFIVGAGISAPEIPTARDIVEKCKEIVKKFDAHYYEKCDNYSKEFEQDSMKYYSAWIEYAFPNRIDRSNFFKKIIHNSKISSANLMLAQILNSKKFSNTVFTTNFDDRLKKALDLIGTKDFFVAENTMDNLVINNQTKDIQIVHVHGTYNFYDCANLKTEIDNVASQSGVVSSFRLLQSFLSNQAPIIVGYSGWENDVIMKCLKERLSFPTPLQYIWICYNENSYKQLPDWIRKSESIIFVIPQADEDSCYEENGSNSFFEKQTLMPTIDATSFFRRIISEFKITPPLIFLNPYLYYSRKINALLPDHEDVLHLRHWAQRMRILESNDNDFEKLVNEIESAYIAKDYNEGCRIISELKDLALSSVDAEFVCFSLIKEFIKDEDAISSFEERIKFRLCATEFIECNIAKITDINNLVITLHQILHTKFKHAEKESILALVDRVQKIASKDNRLLEIELTSIGMRSSFVTQEERKTLLQEIIDRCPHASDNKQFAYLKYKALSDLCCLVDEKDAICFMKEAEQLLVELEYLQPNLYTVKSELLLKISDTAIKTKWLEEIVNFLLNPGKTEKSLCVEIMATLSGLTMEIWKQSYDVDFIESLYVNVLKEYKLELSYCKYLLEYAACCSFVCEITKDLTTKSAYCKRIFEISDSFPHECGNFLRTLIKTSIVFLTIPDTIVSDSEKEKLLYNLKNNKKTSSIYIDLLVMSVGNSYIKNFNMVNEDVEKYKEQKGKHSEAYDLYCKGKHKLAEQLFIELIGSDFFTLAETAKTNLCFMIRRKETSIMLSFWDIANSINRTSPLDLMNIILYCVNNNEQSNEKYILSQKAFKNLSDDEIEIVVDCWSDVDLVGAEESEQALSIINSLRRIT